MTGQISFIDHVMATTRREWTYIHEEEDWEANEAYPKVVQRLYFRNDVFRRDSARMISIGYRVLEMEPLDVRASSHRVAYAMTHNLLPL